MVVRLCMEWMAPLCNGDNWPDSGLPCFQDVQLAKHEKSWDFVHLKSYPQFWGKEEKESNFSHGKVISVSLNVRSDIFCKQERIPVGSVLPASMIISRGGGSAQGVCVLGVCVQGVSSQEVYIHRPRGNLPGPRGRHPLPIACWDIPPPCGQTSWHMLVKTLPSHNYCCGR